MSPLIEFRGETFGLKEFEKGIQKETLKDAVAPVEDSVETIAIRMRRRMDKPGPSAPGTPVAKERGFLQEAVGHSDAKIIKNTVTAFVGVGVGRDGRAGVDRARAAGVNIFKYAHIQEHGGVRQGRRIPHRSYVRSTVKEQESEVDRILEAAL